VDVRAFGSVYGQTASLPYSSGCQVSASGLNMTFPACRGIYVEGHNKTASYTLVCTLADAPASPITFDHIRSDTLLPISITSISGTSDVEHVYLFY